MNDDELKSTMEVDESIALRLNVQDPESSQMFTYEEFREILDNTRQILKLLKFEFDYEQDRPDTNDIDN